MTASRSTPHRTRVAGSRPETGEWVKRHGRVKDVWYDERRAYAAAEIVARHLAQAAD